MISCEKYKLKRYGSEFDSETTPGKHEDVGNGRSVGV
jgi:hypothetical protein